MASDIFLQDQNRSESEPSKRSVPNYPVPRKSSLDYAWDYPAAREKRLVLTINKSRRAIDVMEIGDLVPFRFSVS